MALLDVAIDLVAVVGTLLVLASVTIVGPGRLRATARSLRPRLRSAAPAIVGVDLSWLVGVNITGLIYAIEGRFVAHLQSIATPQLTAYFSFVYVYGYAFILTFPLLAYLALSDQRPLRETALAYVVNYGVGLVCYVVFIAYGPRNLLSGEVDSLLYVWWPQSQLLTAQVNSNTNVFPSLHSSLAVTVAVLAYRTRSTYPRWFPVAVLLAASVAVSTMYLGIHWLTDVVVGAALGVASVSAAVRLDGRLSNGWLPIERIRRWISG